MDNIGGIVERYIKLQNYKGNHDENGKVYK